MDCVKNYLRDAAICLILIRKKFLTEFILSIQVGVLSTAGGMAMSHFPLAIAAVTFLPKGKKFERKARPAGERPKKNVPAFNSSAKDCPW